MLKQTLVEHPVAPPNWPGPPAFAILLTSRSSFCGPVNSTMGGAPGEKSVGPDNSQVSFVPLVTFVWFRFKPR